MPKSPLTIATPQVAAMQPKRKSTYRIPPRRTPGQLLHGEAAKIASAIRNGKSSHQVATNHNVSESLALWLWMDSELHMMRDELARQRTELSTLRQRVGVGLVRAA